MILKWDIEVYITWSFEIDPLLLTSKMCGYFERINVYLNVVTSHKIYSRDQKKVQYMKQ